MVDLWGISAIMLIEGLLFISFLCRYIHNLECTVARAVIDTLQLTKTMDLDYQPTQPVAILKVGFWQRENHQETQDFVSCKTAFAPPMVVMKG